MRLWSLHPQYLDTKGLLALWREGLLAQKVLQGRTKGYRNHPQLTRFKEHKFPRKAIGRYLLAVWEEADRRGYSFEKKKVKSAAKKVSLMPVTRGQIRYEWEHLRKKLKKRDPQKLKGYTKLRTPQLHSAFRAVPGPIASWEKT
jgi:Pyrimidine dimer DNA glycosylase